MKLIKLTIYARENDSEGKKWLSFSGKNKKGEYINIVFNQSCGERKPDKKGYWDIAIEPKNIYPDKNSKSKNKTYRVKQLTSFGRCFFEDDSIYEEFDSYEIPDDSKLPSDDDVLPFEE